MNTTNREQPDLDLLLQKLNDSDSDTQEEAALEIAKIGQNNQVLSDTLLNHLQTNDPSLKGAIIYSLGELGSNEAVPALMELLDSSDEEIRLATVEALEKIGSNEIIPKIITCLEKELVPDIRGAIVRTLGNFHTEETLLTLYKYAEFDDDTFVRRSASKSLQKIAQAYAIDAVGNQRVIAALVNLLETTEDSSLRWRVANSLGKIAVGNQTAIAALLNLLKTTDNENLRSKVTESLSKIDVEFEETTKMREWRPLEWLEKEISELAQTINWEAIFASNPPDAIAMGNEEETTVGFKKSLIIAGNAYELELICQDREQNVWDFRLQRSQPSAKIPAGVKLKLIDQDGNDFDDNEDQAEEPVASLLVRDVTLEPGEGIIWQIEPEPDGYQPEILWF